METPVLYSTGCPKCTILEQRLKEKGIEFSVNNNVDEMLKLGMKEVPGFMVDGKLIGFVDAIKWINKR